MKELYAALSAFQGECPTIEKSKKGAWGKYADLAEILVTIRPLLAAHGLSICQLLESDESSTYLKTIIAHKSGENLESKVRFDYKSNNIQHFGS